MVINFDNYSRYYDLLYKDKNYKLEAEYLTKLIQSIKPDCKNIIELGCGTGNHAEILCKNKFSITGIERSAEMVLLANKKNINGFKASVADIENYYINEKFDAAVSLFHVISYLTSNEKLINCFTNTCKHLNPGGIFIFDVWYSPAVYVQKPVTRIKRMEDENIFVTRLAESTLHYNDNIVEVNYEVHIQNKESKIVEIFNEIHPMRHFSIPEIDLIAKLSGFNLVRTEEFLTGNQPGCNTWGVCFILQKK